MSIRQLLGDIVDIVGTRLRLPEFGISEALAAGPTTYTGVTKQSQEAGFVPYTPASYTPNVNVPFTSGARDIYGSKGSSTGSSGQVKGTSAQTTPIQTTPSPVSSKPPSQPSPPRTSVDPFKLNPAERNQWAIQQGFTGWSDYLDYLRGQQQRAQQQTSGREKLLRQNIENTYKSIIGRLDRLAGLQGEWQQEDVGRFESAYQTMLRGLGQQRRAAEEKLGLARQDVETRKKQALSEIAQNLRQLLKATGMQLGAMGAGSSSAAELVAPFAISKEAARAQAQVIRGVNEQLAEIDRKMIDVQTVYDQERNDLEKWLQEKKQQIADAYRQMKLQIEQAKMNADERRLQALNVLDVSLLNNAIQRANAYEQQALAYRQALDEWARNRLAQLDNIKLQLAQTANFQPQELVYSELRGIQGMPEAAEEVFLNPLALIRKRRKELGLE